jgi:hypothetical protein
MFSEPTEPKGNSIKDNITIIREEANNSLTGCPKSPKNENF